MVALILLAAAALGAITTAVQVGRVWPIYRAYRRARLRPDGGLQPSAPPEADAPAYLLRTNEALAALGFTLCGHLRAAPDPSRGTRLSLWRSPDGQTLATAMAGEQENPGLERTQLMSVVQGRVLLTDDQPGAWSASGLAEAQVLLNAPPEPLYRFHRRRFAEAEVFSADGAFERVRALAGRAFERWSQKGYLVEAGDGAHTFTRWGALRFALGFLVQVEVLARTQRERARLPRLGSGA